MEIKEKIKMDIKGKFNNIEVFTDTVEEACIKQIQDLSNDEHYKDFTIKIMPDCHAGKGCTIGTTMIGDKNIAVNPSLVGVDIGCGVTAYKINPLYKKNLVDKKLLRLDDFLHKGIGCKQAHINYKTTVDITSPCIQSLKSLKIWNTIDIDTKSYICSQICTLGSGNHFIEIDNSDDFALIIHSGSRYLGQIVANYYIKLFEADPQNNTQWYQDYLNDMQITQNYASVNRKSIANEILSFLNIEPYDIVESIHNYVDIIDDMQYIRKGAISAFNGEYVVIPFNMSYGTIIGIAHNTENWNYSLPHGAGRTMSRSQAFKNVDLDYFIESMKGVISTSVNKKTMDEAPQVYKNPKHILKAIENHINILKIYKPIYIFKGL